MPRPKTEAAEYERLTLRIPKKIMANLKAAAAAGHRPINTQAILFLEEALERAGLTAAAPKRRRKSSAKPANG